VKSILFDEKRSATLNSEIIDPEHEPNLDPLLNTVPELGAIKPEIYVKYPIHFSIAE